MTVESYYIIAMQNSAPVFQPITSKAETNQTLHMRDLIFLHFYSKSLVIVRNSDWCCLFLW